MLFHVLFLPATYVGTRGGSVLRRVYPSVHTGGSGRGTFCPGSVQGGSVSERKNRVPPVWGGGGGYPDLVTHPLLQTGLKLAGGDLVRVATPPLPPPVLFGLPR